MNELLHRAVQFLLKKFEWNDRGGLYSVRCDYCGSYRWEGHAPYCELGNLIKELDGAGKADNQELPKTQETGD